MPTMNADDFAQGRTSRRRIVVTAIAVALFAGLVLLYIGVITPFRRTLWIANHVQVTAGTSSFIRSEPGGPKWLREVVGDEGMTGFDDITQLRWVDPDEPSQTRQLLKCLAPHARVERLELLNCQEDCDDTFGRLDGLANLKTLRLRGCILTDEGMRHLRRCESLTTLHLTDMSITNAGIEHVGTLKSLRELHISHCPGVSYESLGHLNRVTGIQELHLSGAGFTDESVRYVSDMKQLKVLDVVETEITGQGAARLAESLPQCAVVWSENGKVFSNRILNALGK